MLFEISAVYAIAYYYENCFWKFSQDFFKRLQHHANLLLWVNTANIKSGWAALWNMIFFIDCSWRLAGFKRGQIYTVRYGFNRHFKILFALKNQIFDRKLGWHGNVVALFLTAYKVGSEYGIHRFLYDFRKFQRIRNHVWQIMFCSDEWNVVAMRKAHGGQTNRVRSLAVNHVWAKA